MEASDDQAVQDRANELYWSSDDSVNQIADELELSKGALYGLVEPLPSGLACPRCGTEMEYPNRTARDKGYLSCPACELEEDEEVVRAGAGGGTVTGERSGSGVAAPGFVRAVAGPEGDAEAALKRMLVGSGLLGFAAGVALTIWLRRK